MFESFHLSDYYGRIIGTIILIIILYVIRFGMSKIILKFSAYSEKAENRSKLIIKYINSTLSILFLIFLIILWGVDTKSLFGFMGAAVTFIGVALFAQWSVLSNFTDRKSTRLNSSHVRISYAVFCLKKKIPHTPARAWLCGAGRDAYRRRAALPEVPARAGDVHAPWSRPSPAAYAAHVLHAPPSSAR